MISKTTQTVSVRKKIQTDHQGLTWLHNVKDPSSRSLRWRLRLEEYEFEVQYVKGKEKKAADYLSRLFTIIDPFGDETRKSDLESDLPNTEIIGEYEKMDSHTEFNSRQGGRMAADDLISDEEDLPDDQERLYRDYLEWQKDKTVTRKVKKPNAYEKLWKIITKSELGEYQEESWFKLLSLQVRGFLCKKLTIVIVQFPDAMVTPLEKIKIQEIMVQHYGENKTIERARTIGEWRNMEEDSILRPQARKFEFLAHLYHIRQGIQHSSRGSYTIFLDLQPKVRSKPRRRGRGRSARLLQNRGEAEVFADRGGH